LYKSDKLLLKQKKLPVLRDIQYEPLLFFFYCTVSNAYSHCAGTVDYRTTGILGY